MQVAVGQDKSNGLVTFNQVEVLFFNFFFSSMSECNFRLLLLNFFRRSQGGRCPPRPPLAPPVREREHKKKKSKGLKKKRKEKRLLMLKTGSGKNIELS